MWLTALINRDRHIKEALHESYPSWSFTMKFKVFYILSEWSRRDTSKSVFSSDTRRFSSALFPALMRTHLYNLFTNAVQMGREFSWQGAPLDQNCFCLNFKTVPLWSIHSQQKAVESSSWALKTISYFCSVVWINLQKARIRSGKVVHGKV